MSVPSVPASYYSDAIHLEDVAALEARLQALLQWPMASVADLEAWIAAKEDLSASITEAMSGHRIDHHRDTAHPGKRAAVRHDQTVVQPLLARYQAQLDRTFLDCPLADHLDDSRYGRMLRVRKATVDLFREENIPLVVREQELVGEYIAVMGSLTVIWNGDKVPYAAVQAQGDGPTRPVRERAWRALAEARWAVKSEVDAIMHELLQLRHQMAVQSGFQNYRDYMFALKQREYSIGDCHNLHASVERHVVPAWGRLAHVLRGELGVDRYRPWDTGPCTLSVFPVATTSELMDAVDAILGRTDSYFQERFRFMRENGLMDVDMRHGKRPGAFSEPLPETRNAFVFSNFSPSFTALMALVHEIGHALQSYLQFASGGSGPDDREEVNELYSHSLELLLLDKLGEVYQDGHDVKNAMREELHRSLNLLLNPLQRDLFQHWLYTHPDHTQEQRDAMFLTINRRFALQPVDISGLEAEIGASWISSLHLFAHPFYQIEYTISELGALQLLQIYREDPSQAISLFKQGAATNLQQSIAEIYRATGVAFDFSDQLVVQSAEFLERLIADLG